MTAEPIHYLRTAQHYAGAPAGTLVEDSSGVWAHVMPGDRRVEWEDWRCVGGLFHGVARRSSTMAGTRRRIVRWGPLRPRPRHLSLVVSNPPVAEATRPRRVADEIRRAFRAQAGAA